MALFTVTNNSGKSSGLTSFIVGQTSGDACSGLLDGSPFNVTLYHNGLNQYPEIGDTVFVDSEGFIPYVPLGDLQMLNGSYLRLVAGVSVQITCR